MQGLEGPHFFETVTKPGMINEWQTRSMPTLTEGFATLRDIVFDRQNEILSRSGVNLLAAFNPVVAKWSSSLRKEKQRLQQQRQMRQKQVQEEPQGSAKKEKTKSRLHRLQNRLRKMVGLQPKEVAPFDRQLARIIRTKYPEAWKAVKSNKSIWVIFDAIKKQQQSGVSTKEKTVPEAKPETGVEKIEKSEEQYAQAMSQSANELAEFAYDALPYWVPEFERVQDRLSTKEKQAVTSQLASLARVYLRSLYPEKAFTRYVGRDLKVSDNAKRRVFMKMEEAAPRLFTPGRLRDLLFM